MKRFLLFLFFAVVCSRYAMAYDFSAVCESGQILFYNITSDVEPYTVEVVRENSSSPYYSTYPTGNLTIPETVTYSDRTYSVTSIGNYAFSGCSGLTSVTIGNSVSSIGYGAFRSCNGLTVVYYMGSIEQWCGIEFGSYDANPLYRAHNLYIDNGRVTNLIVPDSVTEIKQYAFCGASCLNIVTIPNSVISIGSEAFSGCNGLVEMTIPFVGSSVLLSSASEATLFGYIFGTRSYTGGTEVIQYYGEIDNGSYPYATYVIPNGLRRVTITGGNLQYGAFMNCSMLTSITIGNSIEFIGNDAFYGCSGLMGDLVIPNSVTNIGEGAFSGCGGLVSVTIGREVERIGQGAFSGCSGLLTINFNATNCTYMGYDIEGFYPVFYNCSSLESLNIGNNVTNIPHYAFCGCRSLREITIGSSVREIGEYSFGNCSGLSRIVVPNSVNRIYNGAFSGCNGLVEMTIPFVGSNASATTASESTLFGYIFGSSIYAGGNGQTIQHYTPNDRVYACIPQSLRSVTITGGHLLYGAFSGCSMLTSITIPNSIRTFGDRAFSGCNGLTAIYYTGDITDWCMIAFGNYIYSDLLTDGTCNPLYYAHNLYINDTLVTDLAIPENITMITRHTFRGASCLTSLSIPNSVTRIDDYAFYGCSGLSNVTIPNSITTISTRAFGSCSGLNTLSLGNSVTYIYESAFSGCSNLADIYANSLIPPTLYGNTFANYEVNVWVPCGCVNAYSIATEWGDFQNISESRFFMLNVSSINVQWGIATIIEQPSCTDGAAIISGTANEHYHFVSWNDDNTDNPRTIIVENDTTYIAVFAIDQHTITVESADETMGNVSESNTYDYGTEIQISAIANEYYHFTQWNDGNTDNPRTITVTEDATYTASFAIDRFTVAVESANIAMGTVSEGGTYDYGTEIEISASASEHFHFVQWNDGNTDNPRIITVVENVTYTAEFAIDQHTIIVESADIAMGTVSDGGTYDYGTETQILANANDGYAFLSWHDGNTDNPRAITVTGDSIFVALFAEAHTVTVEVSNSEMGYVTGSGVYAEGAVIQITAIPYENYRFDHWVDVENPNRDFNTDNPRTIVVSTDVTYIAVFIDVTSIEGNVAQEISIFPNPAIGILNITLSETISEIEIVNVMGQVVKRIEVNSDNVVCDVEDLKAGVYMVRIHTEGTVVSQRKFVKE